MRAAQVAITVTIARKTQTGQSPIRSRRVGPAGFAFNPWLGILVGMLLLTGIVFVWGKKVPNMTEKSME